MIRAAESEPVAETITIESNQHGKDIDNTSIPPYQEYVPNIWEEKAEYFEVTGEISGIDKQFSTIGEATEESEYIGLYGHVHPNGESLIWSVERIDPKKVQKYREKTEYFTNISR